MSKKRGMGFPSGGGGGMNPGNMGKMLQKMIKADGTVASEALFTFALFDLVARKLIEPTAEWKQAIGWEQ